MTWSPARDHFLANRATVTDECKIWPFSVDGAGYGHLWFDGRLERVHVLACIDAHGPRPPGMMAAHGPCNNSRCWNGAHLSWKTPAQNQADRLRDGTMTRGGRKLSAADVDAIRSRLSDGALQREVAAEFGIAQRTLRSVLTRKVAV